MFESTLATTQDADLILKLYQLRSEPEMRQARKWVVGEFFPETAEEVLTLYAAFVSKEAAWLRQVCSYWDMAAAFVLHGALNAELFLDCNSEPFFLYAKFQNMLPAIRQKWPPFFLKIERIVEEYPAARAQVDRAIQVMPARKAASADAARQGSLHR